MWLYYISLFATATIYLIYWYITRTFNYWKNQNVAYVEPVPLFGNLKEFAFQTKFIGQVVKEIYNKFPREKIVGMFFMTAPVVLVRDPDIIKQILIKDFDMFVDRGVEFSKKGLGANLFHADGETWRILRTRFTPMFTSAKLRNMFHLINERGDKFIQYLEQELKMETEQNMQQLSRMFTMSTISACAFGLDIDYKDYNDPRMEVLKKLDVLVMSNKMHAMEFQFMFRSALKKLNLSLFPAEVNNFFNDLIKTVFVQRKGVPTSRNDFMDLILQMRQQKIIHGTKNTDDSETAMELTDEIIAAQAFVFYVAGFETSSTTLGFLLYEISKKRQIQEKMIQEIDAMLEKHDGRITYDTLADMPYMSMVIDETVRKYPIVDPIKRNALADYKVPGTNVTIKRDQLVFVTAAGLHYDPKYFPNPEEFDPERFSLENSRNRHPCVYLPFGTGPRSCIGMRFARVQSSVFLVKLLSRFRVEPSENTPENIKFAGNRLLLGPSGGTMPLNLVHRF